MSDDLAAFELRMKTEFPLNILPEHIAVKPSQKRFYGKYNHAIRLDFDTKPRDSYFTRLYSGIPFVKSSTPSLQDIYNAAMAKVNVLAEWLNQNVTGIKVIRNGGWLSVYTNDLETLLSTIPHKLVKHRKIPVLLTIWYMDQKCIERLNQPLEFDYKSKQVFVNNYAYKIYNFRVSYRYYNLPLEDRIAIANVIQNTPEIKPMDSYIRDIVSNKITGSWWHNTPHTLYCTDLDWVYPVSLINPKFIRKIEHLIKREETIDVKPSADSSSEKIDSTGNSDQPQSQIDSVRDSNHTGESGPDGSINI